MSLREASGGILKKRLLKFLVLFLLAAVVLLLAYIGLRLFLPELIEVIKTGDREKITEFIKSSGTLRGGVLTFLLQAAQVFSVFLPALPIQVAAGALFGTLKGGAICLAALFLASCTVFLSARRLAGGLDKLLDIKQPNSSFLKKGRSEAVLIALCLLPIVPTGAIPYLSARTDLSFRRFALIFPLAFAPEVFLTCAAGRSILAGDLTALIILTAVKLAIFVCYLLRRRLRSLFYSVKRGLLK